MTDTVNVPREAWGEYKRSQIANLRPYIAGETLSERVSISMADLEAGSPKDGDMIARNPANHDDQWLVAADYFTANFEPAPLAAAPKAEPVSDADELDGRYLYEAFWKRNGPQRPPWTEQAQAIRDMWDAIAKDALSAQPLSSTQQLPEAPKVEQELVGWDHNYRQLGKGEIILASDEVQHDDGSWHPCTCVGREAPDPSYTSHRVYRRLKRPAPASDARVISYEEARATAVDMGYPSLTEALEDLEGLQKDRDAFDGLGDSAPASDELLELVEDVEPIIQVARDLLKSVQSAIAKHKGPQS